MELGHERIALFGDCSGALVAFEVVRAPPWSSPH